MMRFFLKKYWIVLISIFFLVIIVFFSFIRRPPATPPSPSPTPLLFRVERVFPPEGEREIVVPNLAILFDFSKPIDVSTLTIKISPTLDFDFTTEKENTRLLIRPVDLWKFDTQYQISIQVRSSAGEELSTPIEYSFAPKKVTVSDFPKE